MFVDYNYYKDTYKGTEVDSASFPSYELKARTIIDNHCWKREEDYQRVLNGEYKDNLKLATCEVIDSIKIFETLLEKAKKGQSYQVSGLSSETVKDHSINIASVDKNIILELENDTIKQQIGIIRKYLIRTGLLSKGL